MEGRGKIIFTYKSFTINKLSKPIVIITNFIVHIINFNIDSWFVMKITQKIFNTKANRYIPEDNLLIWYWFYGVHMVQLHSYISSF